MGDAWGVRRVLTRIVIWWSLFTALTGMIFILTGVQGVFNGFFYAVLADRYASRVRDRKAEQEV